MNDRRFWAIAAKEWLEMRRNPMILWSMILLPAALALFTIGGMALYVLLPTDGSGSGEDLSSIQAPALAALQPLDALIVQTNDMMIFMLLLVPVVLPSYIAAHSIIGEKETKSLEPLLATPVTTAELLLGKTVAYVLPSTVLGWLTYAASAVGAYFIGSEVVFAYFVRPVWTIGILTLSPLLALVGTLLGVLVSSRAKDPRVAQQLSGVIVLPLVGLGMVVMFGKLFVSLDTVIWGTALLAVLSLALLGLSVRLFQRETILTRWK